MKNEHYSWGKILSYKNATYRVILEERNYGKNYRKRLKMKGVTVLMRKFDIIVKTTTTEEITVELVEMKDHDYESLYFEIGAIDDLFVLLHECKKIIYSKTKNEYGDYLDDIEDDYDEEFSNHNE